LEALANAADWIKKYIFRITQPEEVQRIPAGLHLEFPAEGEKAVTVENLDDFDIWADELKDYAKANGIKRTDSRWDEYSVIIVPFYTSKVDEAFSILKPRLEKSPFKPITVRLRYRGGTNLNPKEKVVVIK
jgi:hypothetical protein